MKEDIKKYFVDHKIVTKSLSPDGNFGYYVIRQPSTSMHWFQVTFAPGVFAVTGDLGSMMVERSLSWLSLDTLNSTSYFLGKTAFSDKLFSFDKEAAVKELIQIKNEVIDEKIKEVCDDGLDFLRDEGPFYDYRSSLQEFLRITCDVWEDSDHPLFRMPSNSTEFIIEALRRFLALRDEESNV